MARTTLLKIMALAGYVILSFNAAAVHAADTQKPLYDRLGGAYPISVVVDTLIELLQRNDILNTNPAVKQAMNTVPAAGIKFHLSTLMCQETGGPCKYTGRTMKESHAHLNIGETEWMAMISDFGRVLNIYGVPAQEQKELMAILESTKKDIITKKYIGTVSPKR